MVLPTEERKKQIQEMRDFIWNAAGIILEKAAEYEFVIEPHASEDRYFIRKKDKESEQQ